MMTVVMVVTAHQLLSPQSISSPNKNWRGEEIVDSVTMTTNTNTPSISLPGGGFIFKSKVTVEITANMDVEKLEVEENNDVFEIKHKKANEGVEVVNICNGRGDQTPQHFPLIITWGLKDFRGSEDILIIPGELEVEAGKKILILIAEVKEGKNREEVLESLCLKGITRWLEVCDMVLLQDERNLSRRLLRDLSRAAEGMVTLVTGPSVKDINNSPSMMVLAKAIAEQFNIVSYNMCSNLFMLMKFETMKVLSAVNQDCCLIITVLTMCSYKWSMFTNCEWRLLGTCSNYSVYWPVLSCHKT